MINWARIFGPGLRTCYKTCLDGFWSSFLNLAHVHWTHLIRDGLTLADAGREGGAKAGSVLLLSKIKTLSTPASLVQTSVCLNLLRMTSKIIRKTLEEAQGMQNAEIDFSDKNIVHLDEMPRLWTMANVTRLTLAHNKITEIPPALANMENMEILNLFNNSLEEVPATLSSMPRLRILNLAMNKISSLPRGFGSFPILEVLDLSYNNLNENVVPANFFMLQSLRALYLR